MREAALFFLKAKTPTKKPKNPPQIHTQNQHLEWIEIWRDKWPHMHSVGRKVWGNEAKHKRGKVNVTSMTTCYKTWRERESGSIKDEAIKPWAKGLIAIKIKEQLGAR